LNWVSGAARFGKKFSPLVIAVEWQQCVIQIKEG
jgi:hypothetical protein